MRNYPHVIAPALLVFATIISAAHTTKAQDPVKVDPDHYKVLYKSRTVRILEYHDSPGHKVPKHSHPNYFVYVITDATRLFTDWSPSTACNGPGKIVALQADESLIKPPITHCEENTGQTDTHLIVVEFTSAPPKSRRLLRSSRRH
jgi:beta-alanine degradation protein BauB